MRLLNFQVRWWLPALLLLLTTAACRTKKRVLKSPPHYNFSEALTDKLELKLREISGIAWDPKSNVFLAINDESGNFFSWIRNPNSSPAKPYSAITAITRMWPCITVFPIS